jgi:hypothetical protein
VAGVQFRLAQATLNTSGSTLQSNLLTLANQVQSQLNSGASAAAVAPSLSQFRNGLAHVCFGTDTLATYAANPFPPASQSSSFDTYGLIDTLRNAGSITDCEVPLAIMYWTLSGIQFVDMWSVRRPVFPADASEYWPVFSGKRRWMEGLACFLQFQDQIGDLVESGIGGASLSTVAASNYFFYLPAFGLLPLASTQQLVGFDYSQFFVGVTHRCAQTSAGLCAPFYIEGAKLDSLAFQSLLYPPIDLSSQEMVWLYWVRENMQSAAQAATVVFTNGHVPNQGLAQFDLNYWDYANFV